MQMISFSTIFDADGVTLTFTLIMKALNELYVPEDCFVTGLGIILYNYVWVDG